MINTKIEIDAIAYKPLQGVTVRSRGLFRNSHFDEPHRTTEQEDFNVIRLLGRQTSGNVQKVIFCLEEIGVPYTREDYGRQFNNTRPTTT